MRHFLLAIFFLAPVALAADERRGFVSIDIAGISDQGRKIEGHAWVQPGAVYGDFCVTLGREAVCAGRFSTLGGHRVRRVGMICSNGMKAGAEMTMERTRLFGLYWPSTGVARSEDGDRSDLSFSLPGLNYYPPECPVDLTPPIPKKDEGAPDLLS